MYLGDEVASQFKIEISFDCRTPTETQNTRSNFDLVGAERIAGPDGRGGL